MNAVPTRCVCGMTRVHRWREGHGRSSTRTQTPASDDEAFELLTRLADDADVSRSRLIEKMVGQDHKAHEQLTNAAVLGTIVPLASAMPRSFGLRPYRSTGSETARSAVTVSN